MMKALMDLREMLCKELDEEARKGELSAGSLETVHKLTDTIKNIDKIMMLEDEGGYSGDGMWTARGGYSRDSYNGSYRRGSYGNDDYSGANRRGSHYVRGHYSRAEAADDLEQRITDMMRDGRMNPQDKATLKEALEMMRMR